MNLSVDIIMEALKPFGAALVVSREEEFQFSSVQILSLDHLDELREDVLYISAPRTLRKLPKKYFKDHFFVFKASPTDLERYHQFVNTIIFGREHHINDVINCLLELFNRMNDLENQMSLAVLSRSGYSAIIEVARKMFPGCVLVISDSAYNIIASTHDHVDGNAYINQLITQGYYDKQSLHMMANHGYFDTDDHYTNPALSMPPNVSGQPLFLKSFYDNNVFYSFVGCYFMEAEPSLTAMKLFQCFVDKLNLYFEDSQFFDHSIPLQQQLIVDLLQDEPLTDEYVQDRCRKLGLPQSAGFRLGLVQFDASSRPHINHMAIQLRVWCNVRNFGVFPYKNSVLIIFRDWHDYSVSEQIQFRDSWAEMLETIEKNQAKIGVSLLFRNMGELHIAYAQAEAALSAGCSIAPGRLEYHYSKYYIYDILDNYSSKIPLDYLYIPYLSDLNGKMGDSNLSLLYNYITTERNISLTAKRVHMHRNSVIYRLQKIQDTLTLNLDDPDTRLRLLISFKILEKLNLLPLSEDEEPRQDENSAYSTLFME